MEAQFAAWTTLFTGLLDAAMRHCRTPEQRLFFQQAILDRVIAFPFRQGSSEELVAECLERLRYEGNTHLLNVKEFPSILQELQGRASELRSPSRLRRAIFQIRERYRFGKLIYPTSPMRRLIYQVRQLLAMFREANRLLSKSVGLGSAS
jgi:hypothetical protein